MKVRALVFCILLSLLACQDIDRVRKPKDLIPEPKMVDVLTEVALLHGARTYNKSILENKGIDPKSYLWEKFDIDSLQFLRSNNYYAQNTKQYQRIYDSVKVRLERLKVVYDTLRVREDRRKDSIREADTTARGRRILRDSLLPEEFEDRALPPPASREY